MKKNMNDRELELRIDTQRRFWEYLCVPSQRDDIWHALYFIWRWKDRGPERDFDNFNVLQNDLAIFCWHRCCHQDDLLRNKDRFRARTFPDIIRQIVRMFEIGILIVVSVTITRDPMAGSCNRYIFPSEESCVGLLWPFTA
jgi:hypothetical protein